jgi:hypothetical protein
MKEKRKSGAGDKSNPVVTDFGQAYHPSNALVLGVVPLEGGTQIPTPPEGGNLNDYRLNSGESLHVCMGDYMPEPVNISEVVASFYSELKTVAANLNTVSDELGRSISQIDMALKTLNLGISVWKTMRRDGNNPENGEFSYWSEDIGYAKLSGRWGICLRRIEGDQSEDVEEVDAWLFNDAPRALRLFAIDHLVALLQKLSEEGVATTQKIRDKLGNAQEIADAIAQASQVRGFQVKGTGAKGRLYKAMENVQLGGL